MRKASTLAAIAALVFARSVNASGLVSNCTQADLEAALAAGGSVLFACSGTITLTNTLSITVDTVLDANGSTVTISGGNAVRLFQVNHNATFALKGITLSDGHVVGTNGASADPPSPGEDVSGAGILNLGGSVVLNSCTVTNCYLVGGNAGNDSTGASTNTARGGNALGAALCSLSGSLNLTNCIVSGNICLGGTGSVNRAGTWGDGGQALGGAIYCQSNTCNFESVLLTNNTALGGMPGFDVASYAGRGGVGAGGALYITNSAILLNHSVCVSNNSNGGGAMPTPCCGVPSGDGIGGGLFVSANSTAIIRLCSFEGNGATGAAGAHQLPSGAGLGGAVFNAGDLEVVASTFSANAATAGSHSAYAANGQGGAICSTAAVVIDSSTFAQNSAVGGSADYGMFPPGTAGAGEGGAVWSSGDLNMTNSTVTGNRASGGALLAAQSASPGGEGAGGGVAVGAGTASIINVTVAANRADGGNVLLAPPAPSEGGGLFNTNSAVTVRNTIIANSANGGDVWGSVTDAGYNICSDGTANFSALGSLNQVDPLLSALSSNGGPTATMSLLAGSPARDAIPAGFPPTDQRGTARPKGPAADIGAFEADFLNAAPTIVTQPQGETVRAGANLTLTVGASGTAPLSYQWLKNSALMAGATTSALVLSNVQAADAATYSMIVTNVFGKATSQGAVLVVDSTPLILAEPASVVLAPGGTTNFSVLADGPFLAYQWWHNRLGILGATNSTLDISNAWAGSQGDYFVTVSNFAGMATSTTASLRFNASALSILLPPTDTTVQAGYSASFTVLVSGIPPFAYQWRHNAIPIINATNSSVTLSAVNTNDAGLYDVVVTNGYANLISSSAQLTVTPDALPPQLSVGRLANNLIITFDAEAGRMYRLLSSTNLAVWSPADTNSAVLAGKLQFVETMTAAPRVFYRVVTP